MTIVNSMNLFSQDSDLDEIESLAVRFQQEEDLEAQEGPEDPHLDDEENLYSKVQNKIFIYIKIDLSHLDAQFHSELPCTQSCVSSILLTFIFISIISYHLIVLLYKVLIRFIYFTLQLFV